MEAVAPPNTKHVKFAKVEALHLALWTFHTQAPSAGISKAFDKLLDALGQKGIVTLDGGRSFILQKDGAEEFDLHLDKTDEEAVKHVLLVRLSPKSQQQVAHGAVRSVVKPIADALGEGVFDEVHKRAYGE